MSNMDSTNWQPSSASQRRSGFETPLQDRPQPPRSFEDAEGPLNNPQPPWKTEVQAFHARLKRDEKCITDIAVWVTVSFLLAVTMENSLQKWLVLLAILGSVTRISELENSNKVVKGLLRAIVIQANMSWWNARDGETDEREVPERVFVVGSSTTPETANEAQERVPAEQSKTTEQIQKLRSTIEKLKEECVRLLRANHQLHDQIDEVEASGVDEASRGDEAPRGNGGAHMAHGFGLFPDGRVKVFYPPDPQPSSPEGFVGRFCDLAKEPVPKDSGHSDTEDPRPLSMGEVLDRFFGPGEELVPKDTGRWDTEDPLAQDETADGGVAVNEWRDIDVPASDSDDNEYEILH